MQASRSRILDTDYASETTNLAKQQIIQAYSKKH
jgi:flagellin-like hook-associated protein FlgL